MWAAKNNNLSFVINPLQGYSFSLGALKWDSRNLATVAYLSPWALAVTLSQSPGRMRVAAGARKSAHDDLLQKQLCGGVLPSHRARAFHLIQRHG